MDITVGIPTIHPFSTTYTDTQPFTLTVVSLPLMANRLMAKILLIPSRFSDLCMNMAFLTSRFLCHSGSAPFLGHVQNELMMNITHGQATMFFHSCAEFLLAWQG